MSQRYIGGLIYNPPGGFSGYFDGSGDFLDAGTNAALGFGTGDFTVEAWIYRNASGTFPIYTNGPASSGSWAFYVFSDKLQTDYYGGTSLAGATSIPLNTWNHVAVVRSGSTLSIYLNGNRDATTTTSSNNTTSNGVVGRDWTNGSGSPNGYISNFRVVKGTAVYSGTSYTVPTSQLQAISGTSLLTCAYPTFRDGSSNNFTITVNGNTAVSAQNPFPQTQLPNPALGNQGNGVYSMSQYQALRSQNLWPAIDQYWPYVTMMLHGNGTNGAQNNTFLDSSTNNFTITRNGNTTQGTFTPYGSLWSNYTAGSPSAASRVDVSGASGIFGTNISYTMEGWFMFTTNSAGDAPNIITINTNTFPNRWLWDAGLSGGTLTLRLYTESNAVVFNSTATPYTLGTWVHLAVVNDNAANTCTFYINGIASGSRAKVSLTAASTLNLLCNSTSVSSAMPFYVSNFRIVNNVALYTSNFTPSTSPLTAVSGTALLAFQSNRFIDTSGSNLTLTVNGTNQIQRFSPFAPTTPYAAGTIGGSGYFDGSGDSLSAGDQTAFEFGAGAFTIEAWVYPTSYSSVFTIAQKYVGGDVANSEFLFYATTAGRLAIALDGGGGEDFFQSATGLVPLNTWTHCAVTKSGSTVLLFVNGVQVQSGTSSRTLNSTSTALFAGVSGTAGYMTDLRLLKGTALYTGAFTPPSAPLTNITNTSLLLNFTNAGIIDNAMMNDLETVGNAQISTTQSKFGGGSLAFDGSGDYLVSAATNLPFTFNTGDFTVECWLYPASVSGGTITIVSNRFDAGADTVLIFAFGTTNGLFFHTQATAVLNSGTNLTANTWQHVALCRAGGTVRIFLNGVQVGSSVSSAQNLSATASVFVGQDGTKGAGAAAQYNGYIDDLRITKYARYTANFTPQRSQWQDQ